MITNPYIIIEKLENGGVHIVTESADEYYIGLSLKDAESQFRYEHDLKGKRLQRLCTVQT